MKRILLVEDDPEWQGKISRLLAAQGHAVDLARDGHEAIAAVRKALPNLVILDVVLPKMNGLHVARLLKFDAKCKGVPLLMITILDQPSDRKKGEAAGVDLYLSKPFSDEDFLKAVQQLLAKG